jgi:hypothetical protein
VAVACRSAQGRSPVHNISVEAWEKYIIRTTEHPQTSAQKRSFGPIERHSRPGRRKVGESGPDLE